MPAWVEFSVMWSVPGFVLIYLIQISGFLMVFTCLWTGAETFSGNTAKMQSIILKFESGTKAIKASSKTPVAWPPNSHFNGAIAKIVRLAQF